MKNYIVCSVNRSNIISKQMSMLTLTGIRRWATHGIGDGRVTGGDVLDSPHHVSFLAPSALLFSSSRVMNWKKKKKKKKEERRRKQPVLSSFFRISAFPHSPSLLYPSFGAFLSFLEIRNCFLRRGMRGWKSNATTPGFEVSNYGLQARARSGLPQQLFQHTITVVLFHVLDQTA